MAGGETPATRAKRTREENTPSPKPKPAYDPAFEVEVDRGDEGSVDERAGPSKPDYYQILGVAFDSTEGEIRRAYLKSALRFHPDKHGDTLEAKRRFQEIGEAYHVLSDPGRRTEYDDAAEYYVDDFGVEEYLLRFRTFVLTSQGLSIGSYLGDEEDEVHEEILEFLRG
jgi:DnaJ-domain-containing protein 1